MTNLSGFYESVKDFSANNDMINQFIFVGSEEELESIEFDYRTFVMIMPSQQIKLSILAK